MRQLSALAPWARSVVPMAIALFVGCGKSSDPSDSGNSGDDDTGEAGEGASAGQSTQGGGTGGRGGSANGGASGASGTSGTSSQGGAGASSGAAGAPEGGNDATGGTPNGGAGASGGAGTGGGPEDPCDANTENGTTCPEVDATCSGSNFCCRCVEFAEPGCGLLWDCAIPENSPAACPPSPPAPNTECTDLRTTCQYCDASGPRYLRCGRQSGETVAYWTEVPGLSCASGR